MQGIRSIKWSINANENKLITESFLNFRSLWWKSVEQARPRRQTWRPCLAGRPGSQAQASPDSLVCPQNNIMQKFGGEFSSRTHISNAHEAVFICTTLYMNIPTYTWKGILFCNLFCFIWIPPGFSPADNISLRFLMY